MSCVRTRPTPAPFLGSLPSSCVSGRQGRLTIISWALAKIAKRAGSGLTAGGRPPQRARPAGLRDALCSDIDRGREGVAEMERGTRRGGGRGRNRVTRRQWPASSGWQWLAVARSGGAGRRGGRALAREARPSRSPRGPPKLPGHAGAPGAAAPWPGTADTGASAGRRRAAPRGTPTPRRRMTTRQVVVNRVTSSGVNLNEVTSTTL